VLTKGQNVMKGSALDVHVATGQARLVASGQPGKPGRVQGVFYPQQSGAANKPPAAPATAPVPAQTPAQSP
jgi:lipopolysaccharide export system protein LptA